MSSPEGIHLGTIYLLVDPCDLLLDYLFLDLTNHEVGINSHDFLGLNILLRFIFRGKSADKNSLPDAFLLEIRPLHCRRHDLAFLMHPPYLWPRGHPWWPAPVRYNRFSGVFWNHERTILLVRPWPPFHRPWWVRSWEDKGSGGLGFTTVVGLAVGAGSVSAFTGGITFIVAWLCCTGTWTGRIHRH